MELEKIIQIIECVENPYPEDIFSFDSGEPKKITVGRFHKFVHDVVENTRESIIKAIEESQ